MIYDDELAAAAADTGDGPPTGTAPDAISARTDFEL